LNNECFFLAELNSGQPLPADYDYTKKDVWAVLSLLICCCSLSLSLGVLEGPETMHARAAMGLVVVAGGGGWWLPHRVVPLDLTAGPPSLLLGAVLGCAVRAEY
jgi:hypothetical protein